MNAILFDTLRLSRTLRDKGRFTPEQADALAEALGEATHEDLATKADLATLRAELKTDIAELKAELKTDIAAVKGEIAAIKGEIAEVRSEVASLRAEIGGIKADILKWVVGAIGFQTIATLGTVIALVRIFAK